MENLNHFLLSGLPSPEFCIAVTAGVIIVVFFRYTVLSDGEDSALDVSVPVPEQCKLGWEGRLLDEPNLKVLLTSPRR